VALTAPLLVENPPPFFDVSRKEILFFLVCSCPFIDKDSAHEEETD
jgi:hypothetical protein